MDERGAIHLFTVTTYPAVRAVVVLVVVVWGVGRQLPVILGRGWSYTLDKSPVYDQEF